MLLDSGSTTVDLRGNPMMQYFGDDGSKFSIVQETIEPPPIPPPIPTQFFVETTPGVLGSIITGGRNIVGHDEITEYGIIYRNVPATRWRTRTRTTPLTVDNFSMTLVGLVTDVDYEYRAYVNSPSTGFTGNTLTIRTAPAPPPDPEI